MANRPKPDKRAKNDPAITVKYLVVEKALEQWIIYSNLVNFTSFTSGLFDELPLINSVVRFHVLLF